MKLALQTLASRKTLTHRIPRGTTAVVVALLALHLTGPSAQAERLSLERAIELAMDADSQLAAAQAELDAAQADVTAARSLRQPRLDLEAGVMRTDNPVAVFSQKLLQESFTAGDFALDQLNSPSAHDDFSARVTARQPVWSGGRIRHGIDAASFAAEGYEGLHEAARQRLVRRVTAAYADSMVAARSLEAAQRALDTATAHVELATSLFEGGLAVESDPLLAEVRESERREALLQALATRQIAFATLNLMIGRAAGEELQVDPDLGNDVLTALDGDSQSVADLDALVRRALDGRPDLVAFRRLHQAALAKARLTNALSRPSLGFEASLEAHDPDFFGTEGTHGTLMLGFKVPLFDGGERRAQQRRGEAESRRALAEVERLEDGVELEVRRAFYGRQTAQQRVTLAEKGLRLARRSLEIVEDRYKNGITPLVDLLDAQTALAHSEVRLIAAERDSTLAHIALSLAIGDL